MSVSRTEVCIFRKMIPYYQNGVEVLGLWEVSYEIHSYVLKRPSKMRISCKNLDGAMVSCLCLWQTMHYCMNSLRSRLIVGQVTNSVSFFSIFKYPQWPSVGEVWLLWRTFCTQFDPQGITSLPFQKNNLSWKTESAVDGSVVKTRWISGCKVVCCCMSCLSYSEFEINGMNSDASVL